MMKVTEANHPEKRKGHHLLLSKLKLQRKRFVIIIKLVIKKACNYKSDQIQPMFIIHFPCIYYPKSQRVGFLFLMTTLLRIYI